VVALTLALWISLALVAGPGRSPGASRYQYPNALLVLVLAAELAAGTRLNRRAELLVIGLLGFSLIANIANLRDGAHFFTEQSEINRAELAALELSRNTVQPTFSPEGPESYPPALGHYLQFVDAASYFSFTAKFGSPADTASELERTSEIAREAADIVLVRAQRLVLSPASTLSAGPGALTVQAAARVEAVPHSSCLQLRPETGPSAVILTVPRQGLVFQSSAGAGGSVTLRRFADAFSAAAGAITPASILTLKPAADASSVPWRATITATGRPVRVCPAAA